MPRFAKSLSALRTLRFDRLVRFSAVVLGLVLLDDGTQGAEETVQSPVRGVDTAPGGGSILNGEFSFQRFDPSLGILNSVTLTLEGNYNVSFFLENNSEESDLQGIVTSTMTMGVEDPRSNLTANLSLAYSQSYFLTHFERGNPNGFSAAGSGSNQATFTGASILAEFTGSGSVNLPGNWNFGVTVSQPSDDLFYSYHEGDAWLNGLATYDFTAIPEPSSLKVLLLLGIPFGMRVFATGKRG